MASWKLTLSFLAKARLGHAPRPDNGMPGTAAMGLLSLGILVAIGTTDWWWPPYGANDSRDGVLPPAPCSHPDTEMETTRGVRSGGTGGHRDATNAAAQTPQCASAESPATDKSRSQTDDEPQAPLFLKHGDSEHSTPCQDEVVASSESLSITDSPASPLSDWPPQISQPCLMGIAPAPEEWSIQTIPADVNPQPLRAKIDTVRAEVHISPPASVCMESSCSRSLPDNQEAALTIYQIAPVSNDFAIPADAPFQPSSARSEARVVFPVPSSRTTPPASRRDILSAAVKDVLPAHIEMMEHVASKAQRADMSPACAPAQLPIIPSAKRSKEYGRRKKHVRSRARASIHPQSADRGIGSPLELKHPTGMVPAMTNSHRRRSVGMKRIAPAAEAGTETAPADTDKARRIFKAMQRAPAQRMCKRMREAQAMLKRCGRDLRKKGQLAALIEECEKEMIRLNAIAADLIFKEFNKDRRANNVDLHGLRISEAIKYAEEAVTKAQSRGDLTLSFIVGRGLHTEDKVPKLKPAVKKFLESLGLAVAEQPGNAGRLLIQLGGWSDNEDTD